MSRQDREKWEAWLAADPALRAAWDGFRGTLAHVAGLLTGDSEPDLDELRQAAKRVHDEAGDRRTRQ